MKCSHQSTADAIWLHAVFNVLNAQAQKENKLTLKDLEKIACHAIGYHQGCYRLGLLSLSDVDTTLLRTFAVLHSLKELPISNITPDILLKNPFYHFMDTFEQEGLVNTLGAYQQLIPLLDKIPSAKEIANLIMSHLNIPQPGYRSDFSNQVPYNNFIFDYDRLIINKNPSLKKYEFSWGEFEINAFEYFCYHLDMTKYKVISDDNNIALAIEILTIYLDRPRFNIFKDDAAHSLIKPFVDELHNGNINSDNLNEKLGKLYSSLFPKQDEYIRDEGHSHTAITILAGLLNFPDFTQKVYLRHLELHNIKLIEGGEVPIFKNMFAKP
jgi:hypothetical protein